MSWRLLGPLDASQPRSAARHAVERLSDLAELAGPELAVEPGLYALATGDPAALAGFWWRLGPDYLDQGPGETPDRVPPLTGALLDGLTDAVWWRSALLGAHHRLPLLVVMEWPPELGARASEDAHRVFAPDEPDGSNPSAPRSLIAIVTARLEVLGGRHRARWRLMYPSELHAGGELGADWLTAALAAPVEPPPAHDLADARTPLTLPGPLGVGIALDHWLTRELRPWPRGTARPELGATVVRDVGDPNAAQLRRGAGQTVAILGATALFGALAHWLAERDLVSQDAPHLPPPFPSLADCSLDDVRFREQLLVQLEGPAPRLTLCGRLQRVSRIAPGEPGAGENAGRYALAQACFVAVGSPAIYASSTDTKSVEPSLILDNPTRKKADLVRTLDVLEEDCDAVGQQVETLLKGAVLAAHIAPDPSLAALDNPDTRPALLGSLLSASHASAQPGAPVIHNAINVEQGVQLGLDAPLALPEGDAARFWAGVPTRPGDVLATTPRLSDYLTARFDNDERKAVSTHLWSCHVQLTGDEVTHPAERREAVARWGLPVPMPTTYGRGDVRAQLHLDAILSSLRVDAHDLGPCWHVIDQTLSGYQPVHPLLGAPEAEGWPSEEQRVCGQVCAVAYGVRGSAVRIDGRWWTSDQDLAQCVGAGAPMPDALRIPWPEVGQNSSEICAFNLISQGYVGGADAPLLGAGSSPIAWAGQDSKHPERAGNPSGLGPRAAVELAKAAKAGDGLGSGTVDPGVWSEDNCRRVAAQCYVGLLLDATQGDELSSWSASWSELLPWISDNQAWSRSDGGVTVQRSAHPWCGPIWSALDPEEIEKKQVLDVLCRSAIHQTGQAVQSWMDDLLERYNTGDQP